MSSAGGEDFYWMVTEFYKSNPVPGFRICAHDECESLGEISDEEEQDEAGEGHSLFFPTKVYTGGFFKQIN